MTSSSEVKSGSSKANKIIWSLAGIIIGIIGLIIIGDLISSSSPPPKSKNEGYVSEAAKPRSGTKPSIEKNEPETHVPQPVQPSALTLNTKIREADSQLDGLAIRLDRIVDGIEDQVYRQNLTEIKRLHDQTNMIWNHCMELTQLMGSIEYYAQENQSGDIDDEFGKVKVYAGNVEARSVLCEEIADDNHHHLIGLSRQLGGGSLQLSVIRESFIEWPEGL